MSSSSLASAFFVSAGGSDSCGHPEEIRDIGGLRIAECTRCGAGYRLSRAAGEAWPVWARDRGLDRLRPLVSADAARRILTSAPSVAVPAPSHVPALFLTPGAGRYRDRVGRIVVLRSRPYGDLEAVPDATQGVIDYWYGPSGAVYGHHIPADQDLMEFLGA